MENEKKQPKSFVLVEFDGLGSAQFGITSSNITPMQLMLVGDYLLMIAKSQILAHEQEVREQQEHNKIQVAEGKVVTSRR